MSVPDAVVRIPAYPLPDRSVIQPRAPADGFAEIGPGRTLTADVVIVGTGPGGAAAARVLAAGGLKVVLLEEGPSTSRFARNHAHTARYHMQEGGLVLARGPVGIPVAAGRGVGGGTLVNSALSFRTPNEVLAHWATLLDDEGWGPDEMTRLYEEVEPIVGVHITLPEVAGGNNALIARGVAALGHSGGLAPRSTPGCVGCGVCNFGCPSNGKASTNLTFLPQAVANGALIQAEVKVVEVLVEGGRAVGLRGHAVHPDTGAIGGEVVVRAPRVVLSAGAIGTPRLLWHCGLAAQMGPVGEGLHIHPGNAVIGICDERIELWKGATQGAFFTAAHLPGVLPHTFTAPPEACLTAIGAVGPRLAEGLDLLPHLCGLIVMVSDDSQGQVRAFGDGRANITYDLLDSDVVRIKAGMVESAKVLAAGGAHTFTAPIHGIGRHRSVEAFAAALESRQPSDFVMYSAHPQSTMRMGKDPATSVLAPSGEAHTIPGLWVADASVFPTSLGVNPQLTTMAAGTRIGRTLLARG